MHAYLEPQSSVFSHIRRNFYEEQIFFLETEMHSIVLLLPLQNKRIYLLCQLSRVIILFYFWKGVSGSKNTDQYYEPLSHRLLTKIRAQHSL